MIAQKDLAKQWDVSPQYIHKLVKRGMPLDSPEAAEQWRAANEQRGSKAAAAVEDAQRRRARDASPTPGNPATPKPRDQEVLDDANDALFCFRCRMLSRGEKAGGKVLNLLDQMQESFRELARVTRLELTND